MERALAPPAVAKFERYLYDFISQRDIYSTPSISTSAGSSVLYGASNSLSATLYSDAASQTSYQSEYSIVGSQHIDAANVAKKGSQPVRT
eukprot:g45865.t1